ncbi:MAG: DUF4236 domain-containing protein [Chloroflexi bacterium]|nr:DUF4236 domain-containing protein [Chloroflexota bacterium]
MSLRFNKRISLGKFFKVNLGKSGASFSVGIPGAHFTTGTSGNRVTVGIPGTGLSYTQKLDDKKKRSTIKDSASAPSTLSTPSFTSPLENELIAGLNALHNGDAATALGHFSKVSADEPGAALMAAYLLARQNENAKAIALLEPILKNDVKLPTLLMIQQMNDVRLEIVLTPNVRATLSANSLAVALLLAELL